MKLQDMSFNGINCQAMMMMPYLFNNEPMALDAPLNEGMPKPEIHVSMYETETLLGVQFILQWGAKSKDYNVEDYTDHEEERYQYIVKAFEDDCCTYKQVFDNADIIEGGDTILDDMKNTLKKWYFEAGTE